MSYIAPAGTPLRFADLAAGLTAGLFERRSDAELCALLSRQSGQPHAWTMASGRAAMSVILRAMKTAARPERDEVIVAGYTCYSVPNSIERAGLKVRLGDVDPHTLSFDLDALRAMNTDRVLAIVTANLYGIPNDLAAIEAFAAERGIFMLDDAAQALGARCGSRAVGGFGDAGLYSFDKGKNITTIQGGAIVARSSLTAAIEAEHCALPPATPAEGAGLAIKAGIYGTLLRPSMYGIVTRMPGLGLGRTAYETPTPMTRFSPLLAGLALRLARRLESINAARIENAQRYIRELAGAPGLRLPQVAADAAPVYARFPVFVSDPARRAPFVAALDAAGIGATLSYPEALANVPEVRRLLAAESPQPGAIEISRSVVTLPTHAYAPADLASRVRAIADRVLSGTP